MAENQIRLSRRRIILGMTFVLTAGLLIGFFAHSLTTPARISEDFTTQSLGDMRSEILSELDFAVETAEKAGTYECCVEPPCRICLVEEGSCDCREKLAAGEDICEECEDRLAGG